MDDQLLKSSLVQIRRDIITQTSAAKSGHPGGSLSGVELAGVLFLEKLRGTWPDPGRDRFVLSKGHASPLLYAVLACTGALDREELSTFRQLNSRLQGHPDMAKTPGVDMTTGSLGLGLSAAVGMALCAKAFGQDIRVYAMVGDGEIQEGIVWEALMAASHYSLDNLTVIVDNNGLQIDGKIQDVMNPDPIDRKLEAFGLKVETIDGHDIAQIRAAYDNAAAHTGSPYGIVAKTVKGKGVSFMENNPAWHGKAPNAEETAKALAELEE